MNIWLWNKLIWDFIRSIASDKGLFVFSISDSALFELHNTQNPAEPKDRSEVLSEFNYVCNELIHRNGLKYVFDDSVWYPDEQNLSLVACLVAQQVIAAEEMRSFSYYESYINIIDPLRQDDLEVRQLPFSASEFLRLWDTFKNELNQQLGLISEQITFRRGTGMNTFRWYPISQSLLSVLDLEKLAIRLDSSPISDVSYSVFIKSNINELSLRGREKVKDSSFFPLIESQFLDYLEFRTATPSGSKKLTKNQRVDELLSIVFCDYGEEFFYKLFIQAGSEISNKVDLKGLGKKEKTVFIPERGGVWKEVKGSLSNLDIYDSVILLANENAIDSISSRLDGSGIYVDKIELRVGDEDLVGYSAIMLERDSLPTGFSLNRFLGQSVKLYNNALRFSGGIIGDGRKQEYIVSYPPKSLFYGNDDISEVRRVYFDKKNISYYEIKDVITNSQNDDVYFFRYKSSEAKFSVSKERKHTEHKQIGYMVRNGKLSPISSFIENEAESYYSGFSLHNCIACSARDTPKRLLYNYLHIPVEKWVKCGEEDLARIRIIVSQHSDPIISRFGDLIAISKFAPYPLLKKIMR